MTKSSALSPDNKIARAALKLAARHAWDDLTLAQIAKTAKLTLPQVRKHFSDTHSIIPAIVRLIDDETAKAVGKVDPRDSAHDRLFEILMARFDALQSHRAGILSIAKACRGSPQRAHAVLKAQRESMQKMFQLAHLETGGAHRIVHQMGLYILYLLVLFRWQQDRTKDMAPTMATLDRALKLAESIRNHTIIMD